jgi:hypothetical protein
VLEWGKEIGRKENRMKNEQCNGNRLGISQQKRTWNGDRRKNGVVGSNRVSLLGSGKVLLGVLLAGLSSSQHGFKARRIAGGLGSLTLAGLPNLAPMNFHLLASYSFMAASRAADSSLSNSA